jgi:hypothetical protein
MVNFKTPAEHKNFFMTVCFLLIFNFIPADCYAQSQNEDQQRIAGTWISLEDQDYSLIFYPNRSYSVVEYGETTESGKWRIIATRNIMYITDSDNIEYECEYLLSNDGRTLVIIDPEDLYVEVFRKKE